MIKNLFIISLAFAVIINAQSNRFNEKYDSLTTQVSISTDENKIEALITLSNFLASFGKYEEAKMLITESFKLSKKLNFVKGRINAYLASAYLESTKKNFTSVKSFTDSALFLIKGDNFNLEKAKATRSLAYYEVAGKGNAERALEYCIDAYSLINEVKDVQTMASIALVEGYAYLSLGKSIDAVRAYEKSIALFEKINMDYKTALAYLNLSIVFANLQSKFEEALKYNLLASKIFEDYGDSLKVALATLSRGNIFEDTGQLEKALESYINAVDYFKHIKNEFYLIHGYNYIGEIYKKRGKYFEAISNYRQSQKLSKKFDEQEGVAVAFNNIGECSYSLKNYDSALENYRKALKFFQGRKNSQKTSIVLNNIGATYLQIGNFSKAIEYSKKALSTAEENNFLETMRDANLNLSEIYTKLGKYKRANDHLKKFIKIKDEIYTRETSYKISELESKNEIRLKENEIKSLSKDNKIQKLELAKRHYYNIGLLLIATFLIIVVLLLTYNWRTKLKLSDELAEQNEIIRASEEHQKKLNESKNKLFSLISHDLKGSFNAILGLTELNAEEASEDNNETIKELSLAANNAAQKAFKLVDNLLTWAKSQLEGYSPAYKSVNINELFNYSVEFSKNSISEKSIELNINIPENLFVYVDDNMIDSVFRNLINNSIKFVHPNGIISVDAKLQADNMVQITIEDNGIGIPQEKMKHLFNLSKEEITVGTKSEDGNGLGLQIVKAFVEKNNGQIYAESEIDKGTKFIILLPTSNS